MNVVFMGTPEFAVPSLRALLEAPDEEIRVTGVVTQPDRPAGRGRKMASPRVKQVAEEQGVPVYQTPSLRKDPDALDWIRGKSPDVIVVAAFGQILPRECFELPPRGTVNVHASLLPKYRGAAPVAYAIREGEKTTGVTLMLIEEGLDTGDVLAKREVPIGENTTRGELEAILAVTGAELLLETLPRWVAGEIRPQPQDDRQATLAPMIEKSEGRIDWERPARRVHDHIRAFNPWPGARTFFRGEPLKVWGSYLPEPSPSEGPTRPGEIVLVDQDGLHVRCGDGRDVCLTVLQPPNRKRLPARDFANGFGVKAGERFEQAGDGS